MDITTCIFLCTDVRMIVFPSQCMSSECECMYVALVYTILIMTAQFASEKEILKNQLSKISF